MKKNNPVFDFIEEGMPFEWILDNMGFEHYFYGDDIEDVYDEYTEDTDTWLEVWNPTPQEGFTLVSTHDSENGPVALFVKPTTPFAERLLAFGMSLTEVGN